MASTSQTSQWDQVWVDTPKANQNKISQSLFEEAPTLDSFRDFAGVCDGQSNCLQFGSVPSVLREVEVGSARRFAGQEEQIPASVSWTRRVSLGRADGGRRIIEDLDY